MSDEFFALVGSDPVVSLQTCPKTGCNRRIVPETETDDYPGEIMLCPNCFEYYIASEEEVRRWQQRMRGAAALWQQRHKLKTKYGPNTKSYDAYEGYKKSGTT